MARKKSSKTTATKFTTVPPKAAEATKPAKPVTSTTAVTADKDRCRQACGDQDRIDARRNRQARTDSGGRRQDRMLPRRRRDNINRSLGYRYRRDRIAEERQRRHRPRRRLVARPARRPLRGRAVSAALNNCSGFFHSVSAPPPPRASARSPIPAPSSLCSRPSPIRSPKSAANPSAPWPLSAPPRLLTRCRMWSAIAPISSFRSPAMPPCSAWRNRRRSRHRNSSFVAANNTKIRRSAPPPKTAAPKKPPPRQISPPSFWAWMRLAFGRPLPSSTTCFDRIRTALSAASSRFYRAFSFLRCIPFSEPEHNISHDPNELFDFGTTMPPSHGPSPACPASAYPPLDMVPMSAFVDVVGVERLFFPCLPFGDILESPSSCWPHELGHDRRTPARSKGRRNNLAAPRRPCSR